MGRRSAKRVKTLRLSSGERKLIRETRVSRSNELREEASSKLASQLKYEAYPKAKEKFQLDWLENMLKKHGAKLTQWAQSRLVAHVLHSRTLDKKAIKKMARPRLIKLLSSEADKKFRMESEANRRRMDEDRQEGERIARGGHPRGCRCRDCDWNS
jgi:hypothetical protein